MTKTDRSLTIHPIFFDYGQFAAVCEWKSAQKVVKYIRSFLNDVVLLDEPVKIKLRSDLFRWCKNVAFTGREVGDKTPEIQNRNVVLLSVLTSYLLACAQNQKVNSAEFEIYSGFKDGEMIDCSRVFFEKFIELLRIVNKERKGRFKFNFKILNDISRKSIIRKTKKLLKGSEPELKKFRGLNISCYSPKNGKPCGLCWKCKSLRKEKTIQH